MRLSQASLGDQNEAVLDGVPSPEPRLAGRAVSVAEKKKKKRRSERVCFLWRGTD